MKEPIVIALVKIFSAFLALVIAALVKWSRERFERRSIRKGIGLGMAKYSPKQRQLYNDDPETYMSDNHPQTVFFYEELIVNGYRPIVILMLVSLLMYTDLMYHVLVIILSLLYLFVEFNIDELKEKRWYKCSLILIWILVFVSITFSEINLVPVIKVP